MTRNYCVVHLVDQECYPDDEWNSEAGQFWRNAINGETCYVDWDEEFKLNTYCHIFYELKVDPPHEYDSDYHVYSSFRHHYEMAKVEKSKE